jgi:hypothetical protein
MSRMIRTACDTLHGFNLLKFFPRYFSRPPFFARQTTRPGPVPGGVNSPHDQPRLASRPRNECSRSGLRLYQRGRVMKRDLYAEVSARIVAELQQGAAPCVKPWSATAGANTPCNAVSNRPYSGCNTRCLPGRSSLFGDQVNLLIMWRAPVDEDGHYCFAVAL